MHEGIMDGPVGLLARKLERTEIARARECQDGAVRRHLEFDLPGPSRIPHEMTGQPIARVDIGYGVTGVGPCAIADMEMQMRPGRVSGTAHFRQQLALANPIAHLDSKRSELE